MKAAFYTRQGPARDVFTIGEQPTPEPGRGEVRVRLRTSGVNPSDWKTRSGSFRPMTMPLVIPHSDGAGEIDAVGEGVPQSRVGERVWVWNGQWKRPFGTAAEFIALPSEQAVMLPGTISYEAGACFGIPAMTAMQAVRLAGAGAGATVLVSGGAGGVGHYAIQFAKWLGARVLTTVSGDAKAQHARDAGADEIINYRTEDVGSRVRALTDGQGVDASIEVDLAATAAMLPGLVRPHGSVVVYGMNAAEISLPTMWFMQNSITLRPFLVYELLPGDRASVLQMLADAMQQRDIRHAIARRMPLDEIAQAHDLVQSGQVIGNVVLDI